MNPPTQTDPVNLQIGGEALARHEVRRKCRQYPGGLFYFAQAILGFNKLTPWLHRPLCNYIQLDKEQHKLAGRKIVKLPRGHFKSTICSVAYPLWLLSCVDRNLTIALVSAHSNNTKKWLREISQIVRYNHVFRWAFWDIRPGEKWDMEEIVISRDLQGRSGPQASITAYSINSGLASQHHDIIVLDDPVNEQVAQSAKEMDTAVQLYMNLEEILMGREKAGFLVVGTPWGREDVLYEAEQEEKKGHRIKWSCGMLGDFEISEDLKTQPELKPWVIPGKPILPSECSMEDFERIKDQNVEKAYMQYLLKPFAAGRNGFFLDRIGNYALLPDGRLDCACHPHHTHGLSRGTTLATSDPAYTKDKENCETAILIANQQPCGCKFLLHEFGGYIKPNEYVQLACQISEEWKTWLRAWGVESEALQLTLKQWLIEAQETGRFPIEVEIFDLKPQRRNKDARLFSQITPVAHGQWHKKPSMAMTDGVNNLLLQLYQAPHSRKRDRADCFGYMTDAFEAFPPAGRQLEAEEEDEIIDLNAQIEAEALELFRQEDLA